MSSTNDPRKHLAQKMQPISNQPEIALDEEQLQMLRQIRQAASQPPPLRAAIALFAGTYKSTKAAAAAALARDLNRNVFRIDLAAIVSKFIGETGKNLQRVFDDAEKDQALLFFDEADALFGKRSDVKDSHDRFANIEVNFLLQHLEESRGVAIIAANTTTGWHPDWLQRIPFVLHFPPNPAP